MTTPVTKPAPLVLMVLLLFATQACTDIFLPGLPAMAREFGVTMQGANVTISAFNISQAVAVLFIGVVSDLFGRRATVLVCFALHLLAGAGIALAASLPWIVAMRVLQATGSATVYIVLRLAIKDTMDKQAQIHAAGLLVMGLVLAPILAPVAGAWIVQWSGWRGCFWALAAFQTPLLAWTWRALRETNPHQEALRAAFSWRGHVHHYLAVLADPFFLDTALIVGSAFAAFYAFIGVSSFLYMVEYGVPAQGYATVFIGIAVAYLAGNRLMSRLNARALPPGRIVGLGIAVSCAGAGAIVLARAAQPDLAALATLTLGTCLLRLATALVNPPAQVAVTQHFHAQGASALGMLTCIQYAFAAAGTTLVSGLPYRPGTNFTVSTVAFVLLAIGGYQWVRRHPAMTSE